MRILTAIAVATLMVVGIAPSPAAAQDEVTIELDSAEVTLDTSDRQGLKVEENYVAAISHSGRFVLFGLSYSETGSYVFGEPTFTGFQLLDRATGVFDEFSPTFAGDLMNSYPAGTAISDDGRFITFRSDASNVTFGGVEATHVYYYDRLTQTPDIVTLHPDGSHGRFGASEPTMSPDGRFVTFASPSGLTEERAGNFQAYVRDMRTRRTQLVSSSASGEPSDGLGITSTARTSHDGRFAAFVSNAENLTPIPIPPLVATTIEEKPYLKDLQTGEIWLLAFDGSSVFEGKSLNPRINSDGSTVVFDLTPFDQDPSLYKWERSTQQPELVETFDREGPDGVSAYFFELLSDGQRIVTRRRGIYSLNDRTFTRFAVPDAGDIAVEFGRINAHDASLVIGSQYHEPTDTRSLLLLTPKVTAPRTTTCGADGLAFAPGSRPLDDEVSRLYTAAFGRQPDPDGLDYWVRQRAIAGIGQLDMAGAFVGSQEWADRYGANPTPDEVIELLYQNVLDRDPDTEGATYWRDQLDAGLSIPGLLVLFSDSNENIERTGTAAVMTSTVGSVCRLYLAVFGRAPDAGGLDYWVGLVEAGVPLPAVASAMSDSDEWRATYGVNPTPFTVVNGLYPNVFGRTADQDGLSYWIGLADGGTSTPELVVGFSNSAEFILQTGTTP